MLSVHVEKSHDKCRTMLCVVLASNENIQFMLFLCRCDHAMLRRFSHRSRRVRESFFCRPDRQLPAMESINSFYLFATRPIQPTQLIIFKLFSRLICALCARDLSSRRLSTVISATNEPRTEQRAQSRGCVTNANIRKLF